MGLEFRNPTLDELRDAVDVVSTAFLDRPDLDRLAASTRTTWDPARTWTALDGARTVGVWRSWPTELTVPGGARLPAAAVGPVTVLPTHRRRGAFTGMTAKAHGGLRELGEVASLLYASEWRIYGRVGYGSATRQVDWTILTEPAGGVHGQAAGSIELIAPGSARPVIEPIFETWRQRQAGEIRRRDLTWDLNLGVTPPPWSNELWKGWVAIHRSADGAPDGYARYSASSKEHGLLPAGVIDVAELIALDREAYADLLRFLLSIDLVREVVLRARPDSDQARWLLHDLRAASPSNGWDAVWVRLLDVRRALEARTYEREGSIVLEVVDSEAEGGRVRLLLDATPDGARCTTTDRTPDLTVPVSALGAAYLGGTRLRDVTIALGADEHRTDALELADALFRTADEPRCSTHF